MVDPQVSGGYATRWVEAVCRCAVLTQPCVIDTAHLCSAVQGPGAEPLVPLTEQ